MTSKFIEDKKKVYKDLPSCECPALQETIYFNSDGLNHILYYRRRPRSHSEKHYRAGLIPYITTVVSNAKRAVQEIKSTEPLTITWSLEHRFIDEDKKERTIKVILIKKGNGRVFFLSIMEKNKDKGNKKT